MTQTNQDEMVIFTRTFDFLTWLLPVTNHFPRAHRHTFTRRLLDAAFDLREHLEMANLQLATRYAQGEISLDQVTASVQGWVNHTRYGNTVGLRKAILSGTRLAPPSTETEVRV